jgi:bacillithiol biosynthesis cysteine-adding enzyme BshC
MGCEDADLDELGHIHLDGEKIAWQTDQKCAIGRMNTKGLEKILNRIDGELSILPHGKELVSLLKECYVDGPNVQIATLKLLHRLFADYGLIVFIPDNPAFKKAMLPVFVDELFNHRSHVAVEKTIAALPPKFKVQAQPREINLFYLRDNIRERIERSGDEWKVVGTDIVFDEQSLRAELDAHPERFSPNVILRGLMQETLLPGIAFIGGGGEIAYWLELKGVFNLYGVPYPVLVIRNSFVFIDERHKQKMDKLRISVAGIFRDEQQLMTELVKRNSEKQLSLAGEITHVTS